MVPRPHAPTLARQDSALPTRPAAADEPILRIEGLTRRFGDRLALDGLSFSVRAGEVFGLLGPNGAGKSTAFQILACILRADSGKLYFHGRELSVEDPSLRAQMGVVFQKNSLDEQLTGYENLVLGARLYCLPRAAIRARVREMLELIELTERARERVAKWSGGMRRRLELARALVHRPRILLMDEPTQGLDEASFRKFWAHLKALQAQEGLTILVTTHRAEEAEQCDRLAVLDSGKLVALDSPSGLASRIGGDIITVEATDLAKAERLLRTRFELSPTAIDGRLQVERREGHLLIPRLVEAFPVGEVISVNLRRPTLADVFLKLTGHALGNETLSLQSDA
jgi:ABC-2 type transport system ATP-binding protein